jgi:hypothetical protein
MNTHHHHRSEPNDDNKDSSITLPTTARTISIANNNTIMPSGGSRKNAGRLPQHVPGQRTLFGGAVDPRDDRNRRQAEVQTVAQANAKRRKEEEEEAARAVRDEALRQERIRFS